MQYIFLLVVQNNANLRKKHCVYPPRAKTSCNLLFSHLQPLPLEMAGSKHIRTLRTSTFIHELLKSIASGSIEGYDEPAHNMRSLVKSLLLAHTKYAQIENKTSSRTR